VLATGVRYRRLDVPGMDRLEGPSVYYAATEFEARLCRGDPVTVVGGGNSAGQAALFLARSASEVNLVIRHDDLNRDMSRYLTSRVEENAKITIWRTSEVAELIGDKALEAVEIRDVNTDERNRLPTTALFVMIGAEPHTSWLQGQLPLDENGYILTGSAENGCATSFATAEPGVLAVGDVRSGSIKRVASAVGEGAIAVRQVYDHLVRAGRR
jgi:thioredoxin reductase (NADPH)